MKLLITLLLSTTFLLASVETNTVTKEKFFSLKSIGKVILSKNKDNLKVSEYKIV